jgi:hypothetical protein
MAGAGAASHWSAAARRYADSIAMKSPRFLYPLWPINYLEIA